MKQQTDYTTGYLPKRQGRIFVTSDTFFGRKKSATARGFSSTEEMNEAMTNIWNNKVNPEDIVIHLGNFAWTCDDVENMCNKLNGEILFMIAEHDQSLLDLKEADADLVILENAIYTHGNVVFCHWPLEEWPGKKLDKFHFHGHLSSNIKSDIKQLQRLNVCCDNWSLAPIDVKDTLELLKDFK